MPDSTKCVQMRVRRRPQGGKAGCSRSSRDRRRNTGIRGPTAISATSTTAELLAALPDAFAGRTLRLRDLLEALGDRGMAAALLVTTLPQLLPLPIGPSNVLALPLVAVAAQMAMGRQSLWLPGWILDRPLRRQSLEAACARVVPLLHWLERNLFRRSGMIGGSAWNSRLIGLGCLVVALVCLAPLPLTGWLPAWALVAFGIAILERSSVMLAAGTILGTASVAVLAAVVGGIAEVGRRVTDMSAAPAP